ncbi:hypothetical protein GCM10009550_45120 [Actinocorallia libanotica]|uniref:Uncharacterized protein n=1 Tax=Actinocorallia libanotica TaxID=46162 RepID=A0ABN1RHW5_9ACTN
MLPPSRVARAKGRYSRNPDSAKKIETPIPPLASIRQSSPSALVSPVAPATCRPTTDMIATLRRPSSEARCPGALAARGVGPACIITCRLS